MVRYVDSKIIRVGYDEKHSNGLNIIPNLEFRSNLNDFERNSFRKI